MLRLLFFAADFCVATTQGQLQFEGGVYFLGNPANINNGWIRCIWVIQWQLLGSISCKCSLAVLLSAMETSHTTQTTLMLAWLQSWKYLHMCACATYTGISHGYIWRQHFFCLEFLIVRLLFEGSDYSKAGLFKEIWYLEFIGLTEWLTGRQNWLLYRASCICTHSITKNLGTKLESTHFFNSSYFCSFRR